MYDFSRLTYQRCFFIQLSFRIEAKLSTHEYKLPIGNTDNILQFMEVVDANVLSSAMNIQITWSGWFQVRSLITSWYDIQ